MYVIFNHTQENTIPDKEETQESSSEGKDKVSGRERDSLILSEVERRVAERLKHQEDKLRKELMQQWRQSVMVTEKDKAVAEIDPKFVKKYFLIGKGLASHLPTSEYGSYYSVCLENKTLWFSTTGPLAKCLKAHCTGRR